MTNDERNLLIEAVKRIPCQLAISTFDATRNGSAWLGCKECARCRLLRALPYQGALHEIREMVLSLPENGGHEFREDLRKAPHVA